MTLGLFLKELFPLLLLLVKKTLLRKKLGDLGIGVLIELQMLKQVGLQKIIGLKVLESLLDLL
jgi:hypothetical protein